MTRRRRIALAIGMAAGLLVLAAVCTFPAMTVDEPLPDDAVLQMMWEDIPDGDNALNCFRQAVEKVSFPVERNLSKKAYLLATGEAWDQAFAKELLERNREALDLFGQGLGKSRFEFPDPRKRRVEARGWSNLRSLLCIRILALRNDNRPREALADAVKLIQFGHRMEHAKGPMIFDFLAIVLRERGSRHVMELFEEANLSTDETQRLLAQLAACPADGQWLADAIRCEYAWRTNDIDQFVAANLAGRRRRQSFLTSPFSAAFSHVVYKPNATRRWLADSLSPEVGNAARPYCECRHAAMDREALTRTFKWYAPSFAGLDNAIGRMLIAFGDVDLSSLAEKKCSLATRYRLVHLLIALKAYRAVHGRLPATLSELVPEYLAAVPLDDYDGKPLRYSPQKKTVYSVGKDLVDRGGFSKEEACIWAEENGKNAVDQDPSLLPNPSFPIE